MTEGVGMEVTPPGGDGGLATSADAPTERKMLAFSMAAAAGLGAVGVAWGLVSGSQIILFDGVYAFLGVGLSWMALRAVRLVEAGPTRRYPFGREALTPLVIAVQGAALLIACGYAVFDGLDTIRHGGADLSASLATIYAGLSFLMSLGVYALLRRAGRRSELLRAEASQWFVGGVLSLAMLLGFGVMWALQGTTWEETSQNIDPLMAIVFGIMIMPTPVRMLRDTLVELLEGSPSAEVSGPVTSTIDDVTRELGLGRPLVRLSKVGRKLYVEVDLIVRPTMSVAEADHVRRTLTERLGFVQYELWLYLELSADEALLA